MIATTDTAKTYTNLEDLLGEALNDQQDLTAVERFSLKHERGEVARDITTYQEVMPIHPPGPGQQYAFEVDLDKCTSCKACVTGCHSMNGLEEKETWRYTGLLIGGTAAEPFQQTVTTACHHCLDPACMNGCPVNAYEKHPDTGVVKHLDDQCIGCKYCTLTCPYDVPQYSKAKGIVRKCDMCSSRLEVGEAPACVQACPNTAIRIRVVDAENVRERSEAGAFLPGAPSPDHTQPTTTYTSSRPLPQNLLPADYQRVSKEEGHLPLVLMLVLTQLSVGTFLWEFLMASFWADGIEPFGKAFYSIRALVLGVVALGASTAHLGRPLYAFRAVLGLKHSWLSREILTFGLYSGTATVYALSLGVEQWFDGGDGVLASVAGVVGQPSVQTAAFAMTVVFGLAGVFSSIMVYSVTSRPTWRLSITGFKFLSTMLLLGVSLTLLVSVVSVVLGGGAALSDFAAGSGRLMAMIVMSVSGAKLLQELSVFRHLKDRLHSPWRRVARLHVGVLRRDFGLRAMTLLLGGGVLPLSMMMGTLSPTGYLVCAGVSFVSILVSEFFERYLYFRGAVATRMPGGPA